MKVRTLLITLLAVAGGLAGPAPAWADWSPRGCGTNGLDLALSKDKTVVRPGDTINYSVSVRNDAGGSCDVSNGLVTLALPGPDGQPRRNSPRTLATNRLFRAALALTPIGTEPYVVAVNAGVTILTPEGRAAGVLHDSDVADGVADIRKTLNTQVTQPALTIDKTGSIANGQAPQGVTYTYVVTNTSSTPVSMKNVTVSDDLCKDPVYSSGGDGDTLLSNGESWTFTCSWLHQSPGTYTNTANACAYSTVRGDETRPVCSPPDTWTLTLTGPPPASPPPPPASPPPPQVAVKPQSVNQAACTLARASSTTVRARQMNTIRVRVRNVDAGTKVTLTLPGGNKVTATANKDGLATFRVRPPKSGTARIQAAECSDVERLSVKPARRVVAQRAPRVTG